MFSKTIKELLNKLFIHSVWEGILYILPIIFSVGRYFMLDNSFISALLLFFVLVIIVWLVKSQLYIIDKLAKANEIKDKLIVLPPTFNWALDLPNKKLFCNIQYNIDNHSNQLINYAIDLSKTRFIINKETQDGNLPKNLPLANLKPYGSGLLLSPHIELPLPDDKTITLKITAIIALMYNTSHDEKKCETTSSTHIEYTLTFNDEGAITLANAVSL